MNVTRSRPVERPGGISAFAGWVGGRTSNSPCRAGNSRPRRRLWPCRSYGHDLDASNDCLGDVACYGGYEESAEGSGLVLAFTDYDRFAAASPRAAHVVLDIIADRARRAAVLQRRLICPVHSNDPDIRFDAVGAMPVLWNSDEWLDANRRGSAADPRHE
ncbi:barstar family protein [Streptomyces sp. NPDC085639]|uniref:barstar family protein n=1 Tax=Streptomyces sp. NPDC085639 TaxID=3365734 RepID=UPI0037D482CA